MIRALVLAALLPSIASGQTLFVCDLQFYPAEKGEDRNARLIVTQSGDQITAILETTYSDPAQFNCAGRSDNNGLECYGFFHSERGSARQLNTYDAVPQAGSPVLSSTLTLGFLEGFLTPDGYDRTNLTDRRVASSLYQVTQCTHASS